MATLYPPVLEAKARAIPYAEVAGLDNFYNIEFKMPDVNPIIDIGHIQVSIKYQATNEPAVNRDRSPDASVLYFNREVIDSPDPGEVEGYQPYFHRKDNGNYEISIPYFCFEGGRPQQGTTYCVQVRFGNSALWTKGSGISDRDFGGFAGWRQTQVNAVPSLFGEWSNVQTVYCYGSAAISLTANYNDFVPEIEYRYSPVLDDPLEQVKITYEYQDLYGSSFRSLVFNGQRQQDGVFTLKEKIPIAPVQRITVYLEAVTKNNTVRSKTLTIVPLKYSQIFQILPTGPINPETELPDPWIKPTELYGEENEDGCIAKTVTIPKKDIAPDNPYRDGSTLSIYRANIYTLETIKVIEGLNAIPGAFTTFKDYSVEMGEEYQYIAVLKDADGIAYALVEDVYDWGYTNCGYGRLMHMDSVFLTTKNHQLRLQGNVNVTSLKRNTQDQFQTTIGSPYPYYQRNAKTNYRTFQLSGLVTANSDPTGSFLRNDSENGLWWDDDNGSKLVILNKDLYSTKQFSISRVRMKSKLHDGQFIDPLDATIQSEIFKDIKEEDYETEDDFEGAKRLYALQQSQFGPKTIYDDYLYRNIVKQGSTDKTDENVYFERKFRDFVMLWLSDGKPKLFRSETEGNMIVMISGATFSPLDKSGRMVYSMSCTVTEIAEYNMDNLLNYNLIPFEFQTSLITGLPRNLTYSSMITRQDYLTLTGIDSRLEKYFTMDTSTGMYVVNQGANLEEINKIINEINEYTFIRGAVDPDAANTLVYQWDKRYDIPNSRVGKAITPINTYGAVKGGSGDYTFSVDAPTMLPKGLKLDSKTGIISGTPEAEATMPVLSHTVTLRVHDNNPIGEEAEATMTITAGIIYNPITLSEFTTEAIPKEQIGTTIKAIDLSSHASGGLTFPLASVNEEFDYMWRAIGLPQGLEINNWGVITGAYTDLVEPGEATIQVIDAAGEVATQQIQFGSGYYPIYFYPSIRFNVGYSEVGVPIDEVDVSSGVSGGVQNTDDGYIHGYEFSAENLPAGLVIDPKTGIISGSPTESGPAVTAKITATDFGETRASASITILVQTRLNKFKFEAKAGELDIDGRLGYVEEGDQQVPIPIPIGTVIDDIQILIEGMQFPGDSGDIIDYVAANVGGGLRYAEPPYYRFSAEYLLPDFEVSNNGVISGRAQRGTETSRTGILKVSDARPKTLSIPIKIAKIQSKMNWQPSQDYRLPDTYVESNDPSYFLKIPYSDIREGNHPLELSFNGVPDGMEAKVMQDPTSQKEVIVIQPVADETGVKKWPRTAMPAGYITITVKDTPEGAKDEPEEIAIKIPRGVIVPKLTWDQEDHELPPLSFDQEGKVFFSGVKGGLYPYSVKIIGGVNPAPWIIRQTEGAEQDPNMFYWYGVGAGESPDGIIQVRITDASGQSVENQFSKGKTYAGLVFSLQNDFGDIDLVVNQSIVPGKRGSIPIVTATGGKPPYKYEIWGSVDGTIIPGLKLDPTTGCISGTPTEVTNVINKTGYFRVTDAAGSTGIHDKGQNWNSPMVTEGVQLAAGITETYVEKVLSISDYYEKTFFKPNMNRSKVFTMTGDPLPKGLTFKENSGTIMGTVQAASQECTVVITCTIPADNYLPNPISKSVKVTFPAISGVMEYNKSPNNLGVPPLQVGVKMEKLEVSQGLVGGAEPFTWSLSGNVPQGLRIEADPNNSRKAYIVGTPTTIATDGGNFTITVTDGSANKISKSISIPWSGIYAPLVFPDSPSLDIPPYEAYQDIATINVPAVVNITGGTGRFSFTGENLSPYFITGAGLIQGNSGSKSQAQKEATLYVKDDNTGVKSSITITVGEITGAMSYEGNPSIPEGQINTPIPTIDLKKDIVGGGTPNFTLISVPANWRKDLITVDPSSGVVSGTRPSNNALAGNMVVSVTDDISSWVSIDITIPCGAVTGEKLAYNPDSSIRAIPAAAVNTKGTVDIKPGFTGLANPTFKITSYPKNWTQALVTISNEAVITYTHPAVASPGGELGIQVTDSGQTLDIKIPVGATT